MRGAGTRLVVIAAAVACFSGPGLAQSPALDRARDIQNSLDRQRAEARRARALRDQRQSKQRQLSRDLRSDRKRMLERTQPKRKRIKPRLQQSVREHRQQ